MRTVFLSAATFITSIAAAQPEWIIFDTANSGLPHNIVNDVIIDGQNRKWIATGGGLATFDDTSWTLHDSTAGMIVTRLFYDSGGDLWIGTNGNGLIRYRTPGQWAYYNTGNSDIPGDVVWAIAQDPSGSLWIGTWNNGIALFDKDTSWLVFNTANSDLPHNNVRSVYVDAAGDKWIGTEGGGLARFDDSLITVYDTASSALPDDWVHAIVSDSGLWIGTEGGLAEFDGDSVWTVYTTANSALPNNVVWSVTVGNSGEKWISTWGGGLLLYEQSQVFNMANSDIPSDIIWDVAVDANEIKWIGTDNGLAVYKAGGVILGVPAAGKRFPAALTLFPVPASSTVTAWGHHGGNLTIFNGTGEAVLTVPSWVPGTAADIRRLPPGFYVMSIDSDHGRAAAGFIIAR